MPDIEPTETDDIEVRIALLKHLLDQQRRLLAICRECSRGRDDAEWSALVAELEADINHDEKLLEVARSLG